MYVSSIVIQGSRNLDERALPHKFTSRTVPNMPIANVIDELSAKVGTSRSTFPSYHHKITPHFINMGRNYSSSSTNECGMMYLNTGWRPGVKEILDWRIVSCDQAYYTSITLCQVNTIKPSSRKVKHVVFYIDNS